MLVILLLYNVYINNISIAKTLIHNPYPQIHQLLEGDDTLQEHAARSSVRIGLFNTCGKSYTGWFWPEATWHRAGETKYCKWSRRSGMKRIGRELENYLPVSIFHFPNENYTSFYANFKNINIYIFNCRERSEWPHRKYRSFLKSYPIPWYPVVRNVLYRHRPRRRGGWWSKMRSSKLLLGFWR